MLFLAVTMLIISILSVTLSVIALINQKRHSKDLENFLHNLTVNNMREDYE